MATLTENVARVTSALADIKDAIISKGVTPTGKCETFADAISLIQSGIPCKSGTFTSNITGSTINLGFAPNTVAVLTNYTGTTAHHCEMWVKGYTSRGARGTTTNAGGTSSGHIIVSGNSFTYTPHNNNFANLNSYYIAIG